MTSIIGYLFPSFSWGVLSRENDLRMADVARIIARGVLARGDSTVLFSRAFDLEADSIKIDLLNVLSALLRKKFLYYLQIRVNIFVDKDRNIM